MDDPLNAVRPGETMTEEQRKAMADSNAIISAEAHKMAAQRRAQDMVEPPLIDSLAGSILGKLEALPKDESPA
jgi:hypothetical protein